VPFARPERSENSDFRYFSDGRTFWYGVREGSGATQTPDRPNAAASAATAAAESSSGVTRRIVFPWTRESSARTSPGRAPTAPERT